MKALIVDDEEHVIEAVRLLAPWQELGIDQVLVADNLTLARQLILEHKPEVAILDVMIGEERGMDLAAFLARQSPKTKIISISGHSDFDSVRGMFVYGCIDCSSLWSRKS